MTIKTNLIDFHNRLLRKELEARKESLCRNCHEEPEAGNGLCARCDEMRADAEHEFEQAD